MLLVNDFIKDVGTAYLKKGGQSDISSNVNNLKKNFETLGIGVPDVLNKLVKAEDYYNLINKDDLIVSSN